MQMGKSFYSGGHRQGGGGAACFLFVVFNFNLCVHTWRAQACHGAEMEVRDFIQDLSPFTVWILRGHLRSATLVFCLFSEKVSHMTPAQGLKLLQRLSLNSAFTS